MMLLCSQCSKIFLPDDFYEIDYSAEGFSAFCSKECKDNWDSRVPAKGHSDRENHLLNFGSTQNLIISVVRCAEISGY
jgi:hypothetical protein